MNSGNITIPCNPEPFPQVTDGAKKREQVNGRWLFFDTHPDLHTLHHLGAGAFAVAARVVQARHLV